MISLLPPPEPPAANDAEVNVPPPTTIPAKEPVPATSNSCDGDVVPIPTFPESKISIEPLLP